LSSIKAILIDLDDTLIDMKKASFISFNETLKKYNFRTITFEEMLSGWDRTWREALDRVAPDDVDIDSLMTPIGMDYMKAFERIHLKYSKILLGAFEALRDLDKMGVLIAIVSRRFRKIIEEELDKFNISQFVDLIVGYEDVAKLKPAPDAFLLAAEKLNVPVEHCLVVGDSPGDIKAGKSSGARTVAVLTGPYKKEKILNEKPEVIIDSIADLVPAIKGFILSKGFK